MSGRQPVIIIGAGGHAKVLSALLDAAGVEIVGLTDADPSRHSTHVMGHPVLGGDDIIARHAPGTVELVIGVGSTRPATVRREIYEGFHARGYTFRTCVHPYAWVSPDAVLSAGVQVMAAAAIQPGCRIGANTIINTRASVDHDCRLGDHVHIAPGAVLGGAVHVGHGAHVGTGATVIETRRVGDGALVAAGACVIADVPAGARVAGVPAQALRRVHGLHE